MPLTRHRGLQMNESECFHLWLELGSLSKVQKRLTNEGQFNQETGKPYTLGGIRNSAIRYMIYHPKDAYNKMYEIDPASPYLLNDASWNLYLAQRAKEIFQNRLNLDEIYTWAEEFGIPEEYVKKAIYG